MAWKGRSSFSPYCNVYKCNGFLSKKTCRACCLEILLNYYIIIQLIILSPKWAKCHQISILEQFHNITVENLTNFKLLNVWLCIRIMSLLTETMDEVFYIENCVDIIDFNADSVWRAITWLSVMYIWSVSNLLLMAWCINDPKLWAERDLGYNIICFAEEGFTSSALAPVWSGGIADGTLRDLCCCVSCC